jgi:gliding motility-associated-like protein
MVTYKIVYKFSKRINYLTFLFFFISTISQVKAQNLVVSSSTSLRNIVATEATIVDPNIQIANSENIEDFTISITDSYTSGDSLSYTGALPTGITYIGFSTVNRSISFIGEASAAVWQDLLRRVTITTAGVCSPESRKVTFTAGKTFYNPLNKHLYRVTTTKKTWKQTKLEAASTSYYGLQGYLATVSNEAENSFISRLLGSDTWMGASDNYEEINAAVGYELYANQNASEGQWYWVSGPEKGTKLRNGNASRDVVGTEVSGVYQNWDTNEPNDYPYFEANTIGQEDYAHLFTDGDWNDYPDSGPLNAKIKGIIEFGDMPGDNVTSTPYLTTNIYVQGSSSGTITSDNAIVCPGTNTTVLTLSGLVGSVVRWESSKDNFITSGQLISNTTNTLTVTNISETTYYRAIVDSASPSVCTNLATSSIPIVVSELNTGNIFADNTILCAGSDVELFISGHQGDILKWQKSTDNSNWNDISNTSSTLSQTISTAGSYYFRAQISLSDCSTTSFSPSKEITVNSGTAPVGGSLTSRSHDSTTNSGSLVLSGYSDGNITKWQKSTDGGLVWIDISNNTNTYNYSNINNTTKYRVLISSSTGCGATFSSIGTISINLNTSPTNISLSASSIAENQASGTTIGALTTTDTDSGDTHSYTLTDTTNYPDNSSFAISGTNLVTASSFDYETKNTYAILVETSDGTDTYTKTFTISITDVDEDSDGDGIPNSLDNCPNVANASQADADSDGIGDACDNAPNTPNPDQKDTDGDGIGDVIDTDDDNDGCPDTSDDFPLDATECTDTDGDGTGDNADTDNDGDGVLDTLDNCVNTPNADQLDTDADGIGNVCDSDDDNDGFSDSDETTCGTDPLDATSTPTDTDTDGTPDCIDTDDDNDGFSDEVEVTCATDPLDATSTPTDTDLDGTPDCIDTDDDNDGYEDTEDAFPLDATEWLDTDADGTGNNTDLDDDNDGQTDEHELACGSDPLDANEASADADADGLPDCVDEDDDNDGVEDTSDAFPLDPSEWTDTDGDGTGNNADEDDDNDGYSDFDELACASDPLDQFKKPTDMDGDFIPDCVDEDKDGDGYLNDNDTFPEDSTEWSDTDGDGLGDNFEVDDDNDGVLDSEDAFPQDPTESKDSDGDGIGDNADPDDNNDGFEDNKPFVSGVLTPNSSGLESTWKIINIEKYPNARVLIYNRNAQEVFSALGYKNDWRGTYNNSNDRLPAGSYYYIIDLKNGEKSIKGWLYLTY